VPLEPRYIVKSLNLGGFELFDTRTGKQMGTYTEYDVALQASRHKHRPGSPVFKLIFPDKLTGRRAAERRSITVRRTAGRRAGRVC
jgi:hypothetical protein